MRRATEKPLPLHDALSKAYALSYPILAGDQESALCVVLESLTEWNVDWSKQKHRTYHKARPNRTPNKMILSRPALLQYTVCSRTTRHEEEHEMAFLNGRRELTQRTLVLRYVKHLLHESCSRSFNVAIGNCRILHKYDHATTKRFYAVLDQRNQERLVEGEPDNKTDGEYRRCKMLLIDNLEERFKEFLSVVHLSRNTKRFLSIDQPGAWSEYIRKCLSLLVPWQTDHTLPAEFAPDEFNISKLKWEGRRDQWDSAEENRMHTIIDPECFSRLAKACGAAPPEQQIDVPQFHGVEPGPEDGSDDHTGGPPELTFAQAKSVMNELERRRTRRKSAGSEHLSVEVDGVEQGRLNTTNGGGIRLDLSSESRQIQVFTTDAEGKLLLASLWLSLIDIAPDTGWQSSIVLEGGQQLGIDIKPVLNTAGEIKSLAVQISYKERNPLSILTHYFNQIRNVIAEQVQLDTVLNHARSLQAAIANHKSEFAALLLLVAITLYLFIPRHNGPVVVHTGANAARTNSRVESELAPQSTIPERPNPVAHGKQITNAPPARSQAISPKKDALTLTGLPAVDLWEMSVIDPLAQRRDFRFSLLGPNGSSLWVISREEGLGEWQRLITGEKRFVFVATHDHFGDKVLDAQGAVGVGTQDRFVWTAQPDSLNSAKRVYRPLVIWALHGDAEPTLLNRSRIYLQSSGQIARTESTCDNSPVDYRRKVANQTPEITHDAYEANVRAAFDLFNSYNRQLSGLRSPDEITTLSENNSDISPVKFSTAKYMDQNQITFACGNNVAGNSSHWRLRVKFQF